MYWSSYVNSIYDKGGFSKVWKMMVNLVIIISIIGHQLKEIKRFGEEIIIDGINIYVLKIKQ